MRSRAWLAGCVGGAVALLGGCASQYRPVVAAINPVGPASQPIKYAIAVSNPNELNGGSLPGLLTMVDVFGDTVLATPSVVPSPTYFQELEDGSAGYVINAQNSLSYVPLSTPSTLINSDVVQTTLPPNYTTPSLSAFTLGTTARILIPQASASATAPGQLAIYSSTNPALQQTISVGVNPSYVVGVNTTPRAYVLNNTAAGTVSAVDATTLSVSATLPVGSHPVYGVESSDVRRAFILNNESGTVSVINVTNNAIDNAHPTIQLDPGGTLGLQPVWADIAPATNQLIVISRRANNAQGYLSIINIPLCNSLAQPTNSSCDAGNPADGVGFGQVLATVPVGVNPTQVAVLNDGTQAFVANQGVQASSQTAEVEGSVSAVNLVSGQVTATIPGQTAFNDSGVNPVAVPTCNVTAPATGATHACVYGHPSTIAATTGAPTGKVYVTSPDSNYLTVIQTDTDSVATHVNLQGVGVRVVVNER